jgi:hypothetical protein
MFKSIFRFYDNSLLHLLILCRYQIGCNPDPVPCINSNNCQDHLCQVGFIQYFGPADRFHLLHDC